MALIIAGTLRTLHCKIPCYFVPRRTAFLTLLFVFFCLTIFWYINYSIMSQPSKETMELEYFTSDQESVSLPSEETTEPVFKIFQWTDNYWGKNWAGGNFKNCKFNNCVIADRTEAEYNASDAVMFYMKHIEEEPLPMYRPAHQKWIAVIYEPPACDDDFDYSKYNGLFNTTWTYHSKSDITTNLSSSIFVKKTPEETAQTRRINYAKGRTKPIAWIVSNCDAGSRRQFFVKHLMKHIDVDVIGGCSEIKCPGNNSLTDCLHVLRKDYKFFLAFESCVCDEYFTDKFWHAINSDVVPIVLGMFNYSAFAPPMSYITVGDYDTPQQLAEYLHLLDENDILYNNYFEWKKHYKVENVVQDERCVLCEYLNVANGTYKVYDQLDSFWNKTADCLPVETYYGNIAWKYWT